MTENQNSKNRTLLWEKTNYRWKMLRHQNGLWLA